MEAVLDPESLFLFFMLLTRTSALMVAAPVFGGQSVPPQWKVGLAAILAGFLYPSAVQAGMPELPGGVIEWVLAVAHEAIVGLVMSFAVILVFAAVQLAGFLMDVPLGFRMVNILDPQTGIQLPLLANFLYVMATLIFLIVGGHRILIVGLAETVQMVPVGAVRIGEGLIPAVLEAFSGMFFLGVAMAMPVMGVAFVTDVCLGILARAVPQINVFIVGFPVKIAVGLLLLFAVMPAYIAFVAEMSQNGGHMMEWLWRFMGGLAGG